LTSPVCKIQQPNLQKYFKNIRKEYSTGKAGELTYRSYLKDFIESSITGSNLSEEQKAIKGIGKPDFTALLKIIKKGYIETKDLPVNLDKELKGEQVNRYIKGAIPNLILTDYGRFILIKLEKDKPKNVIDVTLFSSSDLKNKKFSIDNKNIKKLEQLLTAFYSYSLPTITTPKELAYELSKRTGLLRDLVKKQLEDDLEKERRSKNPSSTVYEFYNFFKTLVKEASTDRVTNAFAETITYGLFLARIGTDEKINRDNASKFIPPTIQIIKKIFLNIAGDDLPSQVSWIVDEIIDILNASNIKKIITNFKFKEKTFRDPFTHFYEDFLKIYDPGKRKALGVYYTTEPVVSFICRAVNSTVKKEFKINHGLASSDVKLLDPCTGTGTFLAKSFIVALEEARKKMKGAESSLIENHLLKNFAGFEVRVSPYVISHLKMSLLLNQENYKLKNDERAQIYLTDTLDPNPGTNLGSFWGSLTNEVKTANEIKLKKPIMIVIGNPPYHYQSTNKSDWIIGLLKDYKKDLNEKRHGNLDDDYVKFFRFAQWKIEQNNKGIIGFITNNGFINSVTFKVFRKVFLKSFNKIYILNLHGDIKNKEKTPRGGVDENILNIKQGVTISILIKIENDNSECKVFYHDLYGKIDVKSEFLHENDIDTIKWKEFFPEEDSGYSFIPPKFQSKKTKTTYTNAFAIDEIFKLNNSGLLTKKDDFLVSFSKEDLNDKLDIFIDSKYTDDQIKKTLHVSDIKVKVAGKKELAFEFKVSDARKEIRNEGIKDELFQKYNYRPFDTRWIYYSPKLISRIRYHVPKKSTKSKKQNKSKKSLGKIEQASSKVLLDNNLSLCVSRQTKGGRPFSSALISDGLSDLKYSEYSIGCFFFPLYTDRGQTSISTPNIWPGPIPNFTDDFTIFISTKYTKIHTPEEIFYYIYAILYSPYYRKKYHAAITRNFPKIPFVDDHNFFTKLSALGKKLGDLHLMKQIPDYETIKYVGVGKRSF